MSYNLRFRGARSTDQDELDAWSNFIEQYNKASPAPSELTIVNVSSAPDLYLEPPNLPIPMSIFIPPTSTPVATPNPSVLSPDQNASTPPNIVNAPTPTEVTFEAESESLLIDICDESWGLAGIYCVARARSMVTVRMP
ncbi:hypothetical protein EYZ11_005906 [Aspergillus tanneri]|uniref:Mediator of RNA polymerase II transcription subunit 13 n=1 Tax=Aspergillus tanneri TaxID=1220188 RepID=A0A4S3JJA3_9EURO|nr:hypothetical protein EYZ11_005906 [Aspergillus tanneri]